MSHYTPVDNPRASVYSTDINDYYDGGAIPAPHRLSAYPSSFNTPTASETSLPRIQSLGSMAQMTQAYTPRASMMSHADPYDSDNAHDKEEIMVDPQGRSAARLAERRGVGGGYVPAAAGLGAAGGDVFEPPYTAQPRKSRKKWMLAALAALVLLGLGVGLGVGLTVGKKSSSSASTSNAATGNTSTTTSGDDLSVFDKDSRLHNSFWAFAYTPQNVLLPACGASQANVTRDIQLLSQLTNKLRLYGANCNQTALVLQAIRDTKVDLKMHVAVYVDSNEQAYVDQVKAIEEALKTYGTENVLGITVGNEYILNQQSAGLSTATATQTILTRIQEMNTTVQGWGLDKTLPLGTSDAGSLMSTTLAAGIDYFHANVHPWFGTVGIDDAAAWTNNFFQEFDVDIANSVPNKPRCAIAETGWPTDTMTASEGNNGVTGSQGDASIANLQIFLDTFVCQANANGTDYFFFEAFDEPWKAQYGGVEPYWGLFDSDRNLKSGLTIPECSHT